MLFDSLECVFGCVDTMIVWLNKLDPGLFIFNKGLNYASALVVQHIEVR